MLIFYFHINKTIMIVMSEKTTIEWDKKSQRNEQAERQMPTYKYSKINK